MTSPNFGGIFKRIYQVVVVQIGPQTMEKPFLKE